jgi:hypothetical protein
VDNFKDAVMYSHIYIRSTYEGVLEMRHGNSDGMKIWLNHENVYSHNAMRRVSPDQNTTFVFLKKGINSLLLKQAVYGDDISFFVRFTIPGNISVDGLEFLEDMPILDPPKILTENEGWSPTSEMNFQWELPDENIGFDHLEIRLDDEHPIRTIDTNISLRDIADGVHTVDLRCINNLGIPGDNTSLLIYIDTEMPLISDPLPSREIATTPQIEWTWRDIVVPISGIGYYLITIEGWLPGSSNVKTIIENEIVKVRKYILTDGLDDAHHYKISIKAVSGSGLSYTTSSNRSVLLDLNAPSTPEHITLNHDELGSRDHIFMWTASNENTKEGIEHYEIWKINDKNIWELHGVTKNTSIKIERPLGKALHLKVRAMDFSLQYGGFSEVISTVNSPPDPWIYFPESMVEGAIIQFKTNGMIDQDGEVLHYKWYVNDQLVSKETTLSITLNRGIHTVSLWVIDDQGAKAKITESFIITRGSEGVMESTLQGWLEITSVKDLEKSPVNITHYTNRTVMIEKEEDEGKEPSRSRSILADIFLVILASFIIILLIVAFLFLIIGEISGYGVQEFKENKSKELNWENKAISDRQKFRESLLRRPVFQKMMEQKQSPNLRAAPVYSFQKFQNENSNRTIAEYERPPKKKKIESKIEQWDTIEMSDEDIEEWDEVEEMNI